MSGSVPQDSLLRTIGLIEEALRLADRYDMQLVAAYLEQALALARASENR